MPKASTAMPKTSTAMAMSRAGGTIIKRNVPTTRRGNKKGHLPEALKARIWQKGVSGNPGGVARGARELIALARNDTVEAYRCVLNTMREMSKIKGKNLIGARTLALKAADIIIERGWGKPPVAVLTAPIPGTMPGEARELTPDQKVKWALEVVQILQGLGQLPKNDDEVETTGEEVESG